MGPNGSGKTTLLRSIAGIPERPPQITKAQDITQSYVGHANALKAHVTVVQNLLSQTNATSDELIRVLTKFNILELSDHRIQTLSAGQRRQVSLARLPLSKTQLWLIDEPTTHLDERATTNFWDMVRAHQRSGGAAIISSHMPVSLSDTMVLNLHG
jgi:heme exporter protein A